MARLLQELPFLLLFSKTVLSTQPSGDPTSLHSSSELLTLLGWDCGITDTNRVWVLPSRKRGKEQEQGPKPWWEAGQDKFPRSVRGCLRRLGSGAWDPPICAPCFVPLFPFCPFAFSVVVKKVLQNGALSRASSEAGVNRKDTKLSSSRTWNILHNWESRWHPAFGGRQS